MITIIFGKPGAGKSCLMTHLLNNYAFDRKRYLKTVNEIKELNANGFSLSVPKINVSTNFDCFFKKFRYTPKPSRRINPYRLGFCNDNVKTHYTMPYEVIGIMEAQKFFNSRMSISYPEWQSRFYEMHRHNDLEILLDTQRPMLIDINIRELSSFIEIVNLEIKYFDNGNIKKIIWTVRILECSQDFDMYMQSGKKDKSTYKEQKIVADYNVFNLYESKSARPKFHDGHFEEDFDVILSHKVENTKQGYQEFLKTFEDDIPKEFYQKRR